MFPSINAFTLAENLPNAHLNLYPGAGHGDIMQYAEPFSAQANNFFDASSRLQLGAVRARPLGQTPNSG
jgi:pimeloyl-ACP methyl ester carboxylesterase